MRKNLAPMILLILLAGILPELLSGNTPAFELFQPGPFLFLIVIYGLPALLIREFAQRYAIGLGGLFLLGLGYGIINEALLAKTVFRNTGVPVDVYDGYGFHFGVQLAWTAFILPWHAMASTILPISFVHIHAPDSAHEPWLGTKTGIVLAAILFVLISLFFLFEDTSGVPGTVPALISCWVVIFVLAFAARKMTVGPTTSFVTNPAARPKWKLVALGYSGVIVILSTLVVAHLRWPLSIYFAIIPGWISVYRYLIRNFADFSQPAFGWFGLGLYLHIGTFSWLGIASTYPYMIIVDLITFGVLWWLLQHAKTRSA